VKLIDKYMPEYDVRSYHSSIVSADPDHAYAVFRRLDLARARVIRLLFAIRTLPSRLRRGSVRSGAPQAKTFLESILSQGWVLLEESPSRELVAGTVTQPWAAAVRFRAISPAQFVAFAEPGFAKIVWNIAVVPADGGSLASTETRVLTTDPGSRRRFRVYWTVLSPFIKLIRHVALRLLRRELEQAVRGGTI
jgi:hypothetical protein